MIKTFSPCVIFKCIDAMYLISLNTAVDAKKCVVTGRGVQPNGIRVSDDAVFKVQTFGAGDGDLKVQISGPGGADEKPHVKKVIFSFSVALITID